MKKLVKFKDQQKSDATAIREGKATGSDQVGGQDHLDKPRRDWDDGPKPDSQKPKFKGIRIHGV